LMKLTPGVDFINILRVTFLPISFCQKVTNTNCKHRKAARKLMQNVDEN